MVGKRVSVVVLIVILALCGGLGTVAVRQARHSAARMQCMNSMKQFSLAFENYLAINRSFPRGTLNQPDLSIERRLNWVFDIWSYTEAHMIPHERTKPWDAEGPNRTSASTALPGFCCPANPQRTTDEGHGAIHYVGIAGLGEEAARFPLTHRDAGIFGYDRRTRVEDIKDGTENTLLLVETTRILGPSWLAGGPSAVRGLDIDEQPYLGRQGQFGSLHPAGTLSRHVVTHALFADLSIRVLAQEIDPAVFSALMTIAGEEIVSIDW
jgi:hypothetical protein